MVLEASKNSNAVVSGLPMRYFSQGPLRASMSMDASCVFGQSARIGPLAPYNGRQTAPLIAIDCCGWSIHSRVRRTAADAHPSTGAVPLWGYLRFLHIEKTRSNTYAT